MREPSKKRRRALLEEAYELGWRHFDVAPLYGLGSAEAELGRFLAAGHPDATVTTKIGLAPSAGARVVGRVQAPLRAAFRRSDRLRALAQRAHRSATVTVPVTADTLRVSVDRSLDRLRLDRLDYLLLHEVPARELPEAAVEAVAEMLASGRVGRFGVSGPPEVIDGSDVDHQPLISAVQTNDGLRPRTNPRRSDLAWFHYSVLGDNLRRHQPVLSDPDRAREIETLLGRSLRSVDDLACSLLLLAAAGRPGATVLLGTTSSAHLKLFAQCLTGELPSGAAVERARDLLCVR